MESPNSASAAPESSESGSPAAVWCGLDHVQLAIPVGAEAAARAFYGGVLGMTEITKPPARTAHPGLLVDGLRAFVDRVGLHVRWNDEIPGLTRCHLDDPFGNRIELIEAHRAEDVA